MAPSAFLTQQRVRLVKRLPANRLGRDFVVGDLHGCLRYLERLLAVVEFDSTVDRLISVGDLVDRGPNSLECLKLLNEPWFHATMGNHEQLLLSFFEPWLNNGAEPDPYSNASLNFLINGGNWAMYQTDSHRRPLRPLSELLAAVADLPQIIVVGEGSDRYNVVHAELTRPSQSNALPEVWTDWEIDELGPFGTAADDCPAFRWSREFMAGGRSTKFLPKTADGLSLTFCGHTVATQIRRLLSHVCIDTGAFLTLRKDTPTDQYGLTLVEAKERRWTLVRGLRTLEGDL